MRILEAQYPVQHWSTEIHNNNCHYVSFFQISGNDPVAPASEPEIASNKLSCFNCGGQGHVGYNCSMASLGYVVAPCHVYSYENPVRRTLGLDTLRESDKCVDVSKTSEPSKYGEVSQERVIASRDKFPRMNGFSCLMRRAISEAESREVVAVYNYVSRFTVETCSFAEGRCLFKQPRSVIYSWTQYNEKVSKCAGLSVRL